MLYSLQDVTYKDILQIEELQIPQNRITCIFGESGAGKSTLLKLLNNLISADQGSILYKGTDIEELNPVELRRKIVMLPQIPLIFEGSLKDNLLIGLHFAEKSLTSEEALYSVLDFVNLHKSLDDDAKDLSGGEKQRLSLARTLLLDPDVFLFDEPSASLDEKTEKWVLDRVSEDIKNKNKNLIVVTHSKAVVNQYAEVTIELVKGRLKAVKEKQVNARE